MSEPDAAAGSASGTAPARAGLILASLIAVATVANLNLSVANVAIPEIGDNFDSSQTMLNLIAVGYSFGLAASVLWFGALGDRYGRKLLIVVGMVLSIPVSVLAGFAWSDTVLFGARVAGGLCAGMAYPTTLALITALWSGASRTKSIALWSAIGGGFAALGPLVSGILLEYFDWGSVFLVTIPLAVIALAMAVYFVPSHVHETSEPVDNLGGIVSVVLVGSLILGINFWPVNDMETTSLVLLAIALVAVPVFLLRERRADNPLYDLRVVARPTFWVAACAGIIVFGTLMGTAYVSQQYVQNVLGYSTIEAGAAILPAALAMVIVAPRSAKLVATRGSRFTLLSGYVFLVLAFLGMLLLWKEDTPYWEIAIPYVFIGVGVGLAGTPASNSLTGSVPVRRAGMASGTADLQRDLGGALMTSILGAVLTTHYASAIAGQSVSNQVSSATESQLQLSFASAENIAAHASPQDAEAIISAAKTSFLDGDQWAYGAGLLSVLVGAALVFFVFPKRKREDELRASYHAADSKEPEPADAEGAVPEAAVG
jgi:MFS transporter, DHA2 family, multidrug resistance protein